MYVKSVLFKMPYKKVSFLCVVKRKETGQLHTREIVTPQETKKGEGESTTKIRP